MSAMSLYLVYNAFEARFLVVIHVISSLYFKGCKDLESYLFSIIFTCVHKLLTSVSSGYLNLVCHFDHTDTSFID